jgi:hypothetical protein
MCVKTLISNVKPDMVMKYMMMRNNRKLFHNRCGESLMRPTTYHLFCTRKNENENEKKRKQRRRRRKKKAEVRRIKKE